MQNKQFDKNELKQLYSENKDFKEYTDKYCEHHNITTDTAFTHQIINYAAQNILGILKVGDSLYV